MTYWNNRMARDLLEDIQQPIPAPVAGVEAFVVPARDQHDGTH